jgi:trans-2,3-dihydro-3-hydroxyanthranilate isomerase
MQSYRVIYIDAFTRVPYAGNPCAILPDARGLSDEQMQAIARETNLSETSFVLPSERADFRVRYFTPTGELPFAGHPTIATAYMLAQEGLVSLREPTTQIRLEFNIGVLPVDVEVRDGQPVRAIMTQQKPIFGPTYAAAETAPCFSLMAGDLREDCPVQVVSTGVAFLIVPVRELSMLSRLQIQRPALAALCAQAGVSAAYVFCLGGFSPTAATHARLLDPAGASEDPFTGSAAGCMGSFVVHYGLLPGPTLLAEQGHLLDRPGTGQLEVCQVGAEITSVRLGGEAVKVMEGRLCELPGAQQRQAA